MSHWRHLKKPSKLPHVQCRLPRLEFTSNSPQTLASSHQLDLAPYVSGSYNAQWNAQELLHGKHMLRSSRILEKMEVMEP